LRESRASRYRTQRLAPFIDAATGLFREQDPG
jgi:hypothetical protein